MSELITNIGELTTNSLDGGRLDDAAVVVENGRVAWIGRAAKAPAADTVFDAGGRAALPGWVDSHTHVLFGGDRSTEFEARMRGIKYSAGGIGSTVSATRAASSSSLLDNASRLRREAELQGTTYLETKTGYGLSVVAEKRLAVVGSTVADRVTYLGAHVVPSGIDRDQYLADVSGPMLEAVLPYVQAIDVFCEVGAFSVDESRAVLASGASRGLQLRVHGNQLGHSGGVQLAAELGAASVDHCNYLSSDDIDALAGSGTVATLLPACDLSTREPFAPARRLLDSGVTVALATNCNPGSSYTTSMAFCVATAVLQMQMTVAEAVWAATRGGALALGVGDGEGAVGSLEVGSRADLQILDAPSVAHIAYRPGVALTAAVWRHGVRVV